QVEVGGGFFLQIRVRRAAVGQVGLRSPLLRQVQSSGRLLVLLQVGPRERRGHGNHGSDNRRRRHRGRRAWGESSVEQLNLRVHWGCREAFFTKEVNKVQKLIGSCRVIQSKSFKYPAGKEVNE